MNIGKHVLGRLFRGIGWFRGYAVWLVALSLFGLVHMAACPAMEMKIVGNQLLMSKGVTDSDYIQFKEMLRLHGSEFDTVVLQSSSGGDGWTGLTIGAMIREKGLRTVVSGPYRSACAIIFMGGKERYFSEVQATTQPCLGFHGSYQKGSKTLDWGSLYKRRRWIIEQTEGKIDTELLDRWLEIERNKGLVYFFHPQQVQWSERVSVFFCDGTQVNTKNKFPECEKIVGKDALTMGIVTALKTVPVNSDPNEVSVSNPPSNATKNPEEKGAENITAASLPAGNNRESAQQ